MATLKPRITVTFAPHRYELLRRLSAARGITMSGLVSELVETVAESLERVCVVIEAAKNAPGDMNEGLRNALVQMTQVLVKDSEKAIDQHDLFLDTLMAHLPKAPKDPRPVITGVRSPNANPTKAGPVRVSGNFKKNGVSHSSSIKRR